MNQEKSSELTEMTKDTTRPIARDPEFIIPPELFIDDDDEEVDLRREDMRL